MLRHVSCFFKPRLAVLAHDLIMTALAWWGARELRYLLDPASPVSFAHWELLWVLITQCLVFILTGSYKGIWRFASLADLWNILVTTALGTLAVSMVLFVHNRLDGVPRSVLMLYPLMLSIGLGFSRIVYRSWRDGGKDLFSGRQRQRILIIGAESSGNTLLRDLDRDHRYKVVGFVDDRPNLRGSRVNGYPVLGMLDQLTIVAQKTAAQMVLIALPQASSETLRRIVALCDSVGLPCRIVPSLEDVVTGQARPGEIREVAIEDLLGRDVLELDWDIIRDMLAQRHVLVTGGGGSIGSALCRQIAQLGVRSLTIVENCEFNLYQITRELRSNWPDLKLNEILADCGDDIAMRRLFHRVKPHIVFHAAAYKHVPMLQDQVRAAFRNNVLATRTIADVSHQCGVECFVLISTDKAVNPSSVMGACKRVAEIWCQHLNAHTTTRFITVRFGNVLDSAGSVVPLFREQIKRGGPVTITHPDISRYFMSIPEAGQLILQAAALGKGGEIFALDMGQSIKIRDLAEHMIRLSGKKPGHDIAIVYTGMRAGEKLSEELFHPQENYTRTQHAKIFLAQPQTISWPLFEQAFVQAHDAAVAFDDDQLRGAMSSMLPTFTWNENIL